MKLKLIVIAATYLLGCFPLPAYADDQLPTRIDIDSGWGGLGAPQRTGIVIERDGDHYWFMATRTEGSEYGDKEEHRTRSGPLDDAKVRSLVVAMHAKPISALNLANLGITHDWLLQHVDDDRDIRERVAQGAGNQQALFRGTFANLELVQKLLPGVLTSYHTDDHPYIRVSVTFAGGANLAICASGQHALMLPWVIRGSCAHFDLDAGPRTVSFNAEISRAVASLMPTDATNHSRLNGDVLASELSNAVMDSIEGQWKLLDAENRAGDALKLLRSRYSVETAEINQYHSEEYGPEWDENGQEPVAGQKLEDNLHATLTSRVLPPNVTYALVLLFAGGKIHGADEFLAHGHAYGDQFLAVPWLAAFVRQHPDVPFRVSYVHDRSMGDKAMRTFSDDMHKIGRDNLISEVQGARDRATLLIVGTEYSETYWIVLPDRRLVLWRFGGPSGLLRWAPSHFAVQDCAKYQGVEGGCVGAVISASGELQ